MRFNSLEFFIFFLIVYPFYLVLPHKWQNRMLLAASYIFYGVWDWRFLFLMLFSTIIDYFLGGWIYRSKTQQRRKQLIVLSVIVNLSILGFFKYFNFFAVSFQSLLNHLGISLHLNLLNIILPVGISFYTFQSMSYTIDIYRRDLKPAPTFWDFALFVSFFPQLVAGPIERATHLLPQVLKKRTVTLGGFYEGSYLIFWGLFQKVVIADNLAKLVDPVFNAAGPYRGEIVLIALYAFAFQIYCDFAGYSNIARGLGKCMGFDIMVNFNLPYFATNPQEFWRRWHISFSTWLRDYVYIPLGGNRKREARTYLNLLMTMFLGGLWHGASWTFVVWGIYHGFLLALHRFLRPFWLKNSFQGNVVMERLWRAVKMIFFFHLVCLGWILFRAQTFAQAVEMFNALWTSMYFGQEASLALMSFVFFIWILLIIQLVQFVRKDLMALYKAHPALKVVFYIFCYYMFAIYGVTSGKEFIYFQF